MSHSKLDQIARLRELLKKWRRQLALKKAHSFSDSTSRSGGMSARVTRRSMSMPITRGGDSSSCRGVGRVPAGHLAVYVGEERKRFVIKMWYLSHPLFRALLKKTEEEIGFQQEGALALPCQVAFFEQLLRVIHSCKAAQHHHSTPHAYNPIAADHEKYEELLQQLLEFSDLPPHTFSATAQPLCNRSLSLSYTSLNGGDSQAVGA